MIKKSFTYTKTIEQKVTEDISVFETGKLLKVITPYKNFELNEFIIIQDAILGKHYGSNNEIVYRVLWFYVAGVRGSKHIEVADRVVEIWDNYFEEVCFDELQQYMKDNTNV
jgi:hypothetical protein